MLVSQQQALVGVTSHTAYEDGGMRECKLDGYNEIATKYGKLIPRYQGLGKREKDMRALSFHPGGALKSIYLEDQTEVETSVGVFPAELITFFASGEIDSLFPLNGQIGFGWSEEDEKQLTRVFSFDLPCGQFAARIIALRFFESGGLRSLILWPGEVIELDTPLGRLPVRIGFRLYEHGGLESLEPALPIVLKTPVGEVTAFDQHAVGIDADFNSVRFDENGKLSFLCTNSDIVVNNRISGKREIVYQHMRLDRLANKLTKVPVTLSFRDGGVTIDNGVEALARNTEECGFLCLYDGNFTEKKCSPGSDCSDCGSACI
ncbi:MAG: membrane-binding protein [Peptococcaceae bacterium]|jgi:hypothetical protein|nr:membrane-binding protein [Peptococcaceae bacterium]